VQFLDRYQIQARMAPALIVLLPLIFVLLFVLLGLFGSVPDPFLSFGVTVVLALVVVYALSFWVQHLGSEKQDELWAGWGGAPTTRMLRWQDQTLLDEKKRRMRDNAQQVSGVTLLSETEERERPEEADERIEQAVAQVRRSVRRDDPNDLSNAHNAEYGFCRNLLGSRILWVATSVLSALICAGFWFFHESNGWFVVGMVVSGVFVLVAAASGWYLLPRATKRYAERYADSLLGSFLDQLGKEER
jgi:hypothetical protein